MKQLDGVINLDEEFSALVEFVKLKWSTVDELPLLMHEAWDIGVDLYKAKAESNYLLKNKICDMGKSKDKYICSTLTNSERFIAERYHPFNLFCRDLLLVGISTFLSEPEFTYSELEKKMKEIIKKYPSCKEMKPLGWNELKKVYVEYMGMDEYNLKEDEALFKGTNVAQHDRSFLLRISLPQVMYDELEQGNDRIVVLLAGVVDHAGKCKKHNNALAMLKDIERIEDYFLTLKEVHPMPFDVSFENVTKNCFFDEILKKSKEDFLTPESFKESVEQRKEFDNLPEEEKAKRKADNAVAVMNMLKRKF